MKRFVQKTFMDWIKRTLINSLLIAISTGAALALVEFTLRYTVYKNLLIDSAVPAVYYGPAVAGYDIKPNFGTTTHRFADDTYPIWSNELGCFDYAYTGEPYTLLVGDSFAWGYAPYEAKWGTQLEKILGSRILKCGVAGYGTAQEYLKTEKLLAKLPHPQMLIVQYFANDTEDDAAFARAETTHLASSSIEIQGENLAHNSELIKKFCMPYVPAHPFLQQTKCFLRTHLVLYLLVQSTVKNIVPAEMLSRLGIAAEKLADPVPDASDVRAHLQNILKFKKLADAHHIPIVFVLIPTKEAVQGKPVTAVRYSPEPSAIEGYLYESYLRAHDIAYIDPLTELRSATSSQYWKFDGHLNIEGNALLARIVADYLQKKR